MIVKTTIALDDGRISDLLCSALEGGSNYWVRKITDEDFKGAEWASEAPMTGGSFVLLHDDPETDDMTGRTLINRDVCEHGLQVMAEKYTTHFADLIGENDDATTADVFLQCCVFGEIIYG